MNSTNDSTNRHGPSRPESVRSRDDWEDWEDDEVVTPIMDDEQHLIENIVFPAPPRASKRVSKRASRPRHSVHQLRRLHSHKRQQTQNARAGIKVVTDMSQFRTQHGFMRDALRAEAPGGKFVDAAALKALEGDPNSASVGNWNWLKKKSPSTATPTKSPMALSPEDRPIVIGISIPPDVPHGNASTDARATMLPTPLDATAHPDRLPRENPFAMHTYAGTGTPANQQRSVWSPDTPETTSTLFHSPRRSSSVYSQAVTVSTSIARDTPPVPVVPETYQQQERLISLDFGYTATKDQQAYRAPGSRFPKDTAHPSASHDSPLSASTTFSADIAPSVFHGNEKVKADSRSPGSAETQTRGWWDHVVTPFTDKTSPLREALQKSQQQLFVTKESATRSEAVSATVTADVKSQSASQLNEITPEAVSTKFVPGLPSSPRPSPRGMTTPIVKIPTPRRTPSPFMISRTPSPGTSSRSGTPRIADQNAKGMTLTPNLHDSPLPDQPPPYSPPDKQTEVKYRAVFPAGHPLHQLYPTSPRPVSPAMAGTMSSQGAINLTDIPLTPALGGSVLPRRQPGAFVPQDHFHAAPGPENRVERVRRRHEKEEVIARKMGGFWKGRGCMPKNGCFGRSGREGRKRRRVWFGVCCAALSIIILIIILCVVLIPRTSSPVEIDSIFVNLTNFPPMPTGVLSVVGPDNRAAVTGCTRPSTIWSCSLPKEEHESVEPFKGNQPNFFMQVQWDNNTREPWNVPNGQPPRPGSSRPDRRWGDPTGGSIFTRAKSMLDSRQDIRGFTPNPDPPSFQEMWFLGNSTDGVVSEDKGGEPTPFYISILKSAEDNVGPNVLNKRQGREDRNISDIFAGLPEPVLEDDGTAGAARFYPEAVHQPVRLYDRGLDSEHYAFYTYFDRSIYLKSVSVLGSGNNTDLTDVPLDEDGGSTRREANFVVTWSQTRFLVQMWTRRENSTRLLPGRNRTDDSNEPTGRPGTMPYPVTIKMDTHGGQPGEKLVWHWQVDTRQRIDTSDPKLMMNDISFGSPIVNPRARNDTSFGGFDGGTGGCRCEWTNFMERVRSEPREI